MIQGGSRFSMDIAPYIIVGKEPAHYCGINLIGLRRRGFSAETIDQIHNAYRLLFSKGTMDEGIAAVLAELPATDEINYIVQFAKSSKRGVLR